MNTRLKTNPPGLGARAFTLVEIAISIGIIGFALVIIIGLLPMGMNVQRDNREDTIVGQDSAFLLEAIRGGVVLTTNSIVPSKDKAGEYVTNVYFKGLDILTNYVDLIRVDSYKMTVTASGTNYNWFSTGYHAVPPPYGKVNGTNYDLTNGARILSYLSTVRYRSDTNGKTPVYWVTFVSATMRGMTGSALEQGGSNKLVAFRYEVRPEIVRYNNFSEDSTNFAAYTNKVDNYATTPDFIDRSNRWQQVRFLTNNLFDVSLKFTWPVLPNGIVRTNGRSQVVRAMVSGRLFDDSNSPTNSLFQPAIYANP